MTALCHVVQGARRAGSFAAVLIVLATVSGLRGAPRAQERTGPLAPEEALRAFQLPKGLRIELVAAEPDVTDPVAMTFDEHGRIFVAEMGDYPQSAPGGRIRLLEDTDGDGRVDRSTVFADRLPFPAGVQPWKGGVFVAAAPDILYLKDTDGDGKADLRKVVFTGFMEINPQAVINNLKYGLDNWIYGANGVSTATYGTRGRGTGEIRPGGRPDAPAVNVRGTDVRFRPDSETIEPVSGRSQFAMTFNDWGDRFLNTNSNHIIHPVLPYRYLKRNPHLAVPTVQESIAEHGGLARVYPVSKIEERFNQFDHAGYTTTACGVTVYRGDLLPRDYRGSAFVCEPLHNVVHRDILEPRGASFVARRGEERKEFLASTDNWFRPVNLATGPEGALYVVDFCRGIIEHPFGIPEDVQKRLDFRAGDDRGRIYRIVPADSWTPAAKGPWLGAASTGELVRQLEHPNGWRRITAQRLLVERQDSAAVEPLEALAQGSESPLGRLHALRTLEGLGALKKEIVERALGDAHARVREHALRLAEPFLARSASLDEPASRLSRDADARVRFQSALTGGTVLGSNGGERRDGAVAALARVATRDARDRWVRAAVASSASGAEVDLFSRILSDTPEFLEEPRAGALELVSLLAGSVGARAKDEELAGLLALVASDVRERPRRWQSRALATLADRLHRSGKSLAPHLRNSDAAGLLETWASWADKAAAAADRKPSERVEAVHLLALARGAEAATRLQGLLRPSEPPEVQRAAVRALASMPGGGIAERLLSAWSALTGPVRQDILDALTARADGAERLLEALERDEIRVVELDPVRRDRLIRHPDERIRLRARKAFHSEGSENRKKLVEETRAKVMPLRGEVSRGRASYMENCVNCHNRRTPREGIMFRGGGNVGPDLGGVRGRPKEVLLVDILDPARAVDPRYVNYVIETAAGRILSGIASAQTPHSVTLSAAGGASEIVLRKDIRRIRASGSMMPEGFESLGPQQLADLLEFLRLD